jgi:hypothetical protein
VDGTTWESNELSVSGPGRFSAANRGSGSHYTEGVRFDYLGQCRNQTKNSGFKLECIFRECPCARCTKSISSENPGYHHRDIELPLSYEDAKDTADVELKFPDFDFFKWA